MQRKHTSILDAIEVGEDYGAAAAEPAIQVSMLDLMILFLRRKRFILGATLAMGTVGVILAFVLPAGYTATTAILPPQQASSVSSALLSQLGNLSSLASLGGVGGGGLSVKNPADLYVALMKSEPVEDAMIARYGLMKEYHARYLSIARKELEKHVEIESGSKDGIIRVAVTDHSAQRAAELANGYIEQYRGLSESLATTEAGQRRMFFEQQLLKAKDNLAASEESLKSTELSTGMLQLDSQAHALIQSAGTLRGEIAAKEIQIQSMRTYDAESNVDLMQAEQELAGMHQQLAKLAGPEDAAGDGLVLPKGQLPQATLEYVRRLRDVKYNETIFDILARQFEAAKLDEAKEGAIIQVIYPANVPDRRSKPHRLLLMVAGALLGFVGSMFFLLMQMVLKQAQAIPEHREKWGELRAAMGRDRRSGWQA
jgi:tyrosine-protein kinase Etk/Wzc